MKVMATALLLFVRFQINRVFFGADPIVALMVGLLIAQMVDKIFNDML